MGHFFRKHEVLRKAVSLLNAAALAIAMVLTGLPHSGILSALAEAPYGTQWIRQPGTAAIDNATGVAIDGSGNVYVTGSTGGGLDGNTNAGSDDLFLIKYDSSGNRQWTKQRGTSEWDSANGVATDGSGNVYVTGTTDGGLDGNANAGSRDLFLIRYDANGNRQWTKQRGTSAFDSANGVATDGSGVYMTGSTGGDLDGNTSAGYDDLFLIKYDASGNEQWTRQRGSDSRDGALGVATDGSGNVYVTGHTLGGLDGNANAGGDDLFLIKYDSNGAWQWTTQQGWTTGDYGSGVAADGSGNIYVTGYAYGGYDGAAPPVGYKSGGDASLVKYDSNGAWQWTKQLRSDANDYGAGVATDGSGNVYVAGWTDGSLDGNSNAGQEDLFLAKFGGNTQIGTNVEVNLGNGVSLVFDNITGGGTTSVTLSTTPPGGAPSGFRFGGYYYDLTTTSGYSGSIIVSLPYDEAEITGNEANLKLMHWTGQHWEDVTISVDTVNNIITGRVTSLSPFGVAEALDTTGPEASNVAADSNPLAAGAPVTLSANINDLNTGGSDIASTEYSLDGDAFIPMNAVDGAFDEASEDVTVNLGSFAEANVHTISVRGTDSAGNIGGAETILLAVYDPAAGFVTGGGWINSPPGAFAAEPALTGRANFGFVSKYRKGASIPTGQTEFQFKVGNFNFHSSSYDWLVISGARAQYKGSGTINGAGDYGFMLTAIDGQLNNTGIDKFRIKIWDKATDAIVYDNKLGASDTGADATDLSGGSVVIHK